MLQQQTLTEDSIEDALLIEEKRTKPTLFEFSAKVLSLLIVTLPLFYGGKQVEAIFLTKTLIFSLAICFCISSLLSKRALFTVPVTGKKIFLFFPLTIGLIVFQMLPLPNVFTKLLSPVSTEAYAQVSRSLITVNLTNTLGALVTLVSFSLVFFFVLSYPVTLIDTSFKPQSTKRRRHNLYYIKKQEDFIFHALSQAIVWSGILCSFLAIVHWASGNNAFLGLFGAERAMGTKRAHWPFINPNHLSVLLQMAGVFCCAKFLQALQLAKISAKFDGNISQSLKFLRNRELLTRPAAFALGTFLIVLANTLTVSRMGNLLFIGGLCLLYFYFEKNSLHNNTGTKTKDREFYFANIFRKLKRPLLALSLVLIVLFFIGQKGREIAVERIAYGLAYQQSDVRSLLNTASLSLLKDYPLFGVGFGNWHIAIEAYTPKELAGWTIDYAHNDYLQAFCELGVLGALFILGSIFLMGRTTLRALKKTGLTKFERQKLITTSVAVLLPLIHALVDFPFHIPALTLMFITIVALHYRTLDEFSTNA